MVLTRGGDSRQRDAAQEASEEEQLERVSSAYSHVGGIKVASRNLLTEPRSAGNEEMWNTLVAKFPSEDHAAVCAAAVEAVLACTSEGEDGHAPRGTPTMSMPPRCSSRSSSPEAPSQAPETNANDLLTCNPSSTTSGGRSSKGA